MGLEARGSRGELFFSTSTLDLGSVRGSMGADGDVGGRMQLADRPEIVVATPSRALAHLRSEVCLHLLSCLDSC